MISIKTTPRHDEFEEKTSVIVSQIACEMLRKWIDKATSDPNMALSPGVDGAIWFIEHCELRVRYMHATNKTWRRALNSGTNRGRDLVRLFVDHWAKAFMTYPDHYRARHPNEALMIPGAKLASGLRRAGGSPDPSR